MALMGYCGNTKRVALTLDQEADFCFPQKAATHGGFVPNNDTINDLC
jgi:hypothetical protein